MLSLERLEPHSAHGLGAGASRFCGRIRMMGKLARCPRRGQAASRLTMCVMERSGNFSMRSVR
jgi:hypothetical protein